MRYFRSMGMVAILALGCAAGSIVPKASGAEPVTEAEARAWIRQTVPLPKEISFSGKVPCPNAKAVRIRIAPDAPEPVRAARAHLLAILGHKDGEAEKPNGAAFTIRMGVLDEAGEVMGEPVGDAGRLSGVNYPGQAYLIRRVGEGGLLLAGGTARGVFYAAVTLGQILRASLAAARPTVPLVSVTDWPDLRERGPWNGRITKSLVNDISVLKMNFLIRTMGLVLEKGESGPVARAHFREKDLRDYARTRGVNLLPKLTHLNFLDSTFAKDYPELVGRGESAVGPKGHRVPCASNPLLVAVLAGWMRDCARQGLDEISAWTTEYYGQCACERCAGENQFALEARAFVHAWEQTRRTYPDFRIRIFTSTSVNGVVGEHMPPDTLERFLAEIPKSIPIERACFPRLGKEPGTWVDPPFDEAARKGYRMISYRGPNIVRNKLAFDAGGARAYFADLALRRGWEAGYSFFFLGQMYPLFTDFRAEAIAEWSWNAGGRDLREFAAAWAARRNYADPGAFAEWAVAFAGPADALNLVRWPGKADCAKAMEGTVGRRFLSLDAAREAVAVADGLVRQAEKLGEPLPLLEARTLRAKRAVDLAFAELAAAAAAGRPLAPKAEAVRDRLAAYLPILDERAEAFRVDNPRFVKRQKSVAERFAANLEAIIAEEK